MQTVPHCVNHPRVETRLSCSSCGDPICTRCMRPAAVGQKCPRCARTPRSARALGKPSQYAKGILAGLSVAVIGGMLLNQLLAAVGFGGILLRALLGYLVGRSVRWGTSGQSQQPFLSIAVGLGVLGAVVSLGPAVPGGVFAILGVAAAGYFAARGLQG